MDLAVPGWPIRFLLVEDRSAGGVCDRKSAVRTGSTSCRQVAACNSSPSMPVKLSGENRTAGRRSV
jgi:hypothetical protein